ncbi:MAG: hypothetical protein ACI9JM_001123 [Halioglobus sp.]|jgi:hypothetical protein
MAVVSETIPTQLQAEVNAALVWFNASQSNTFEVTGIVDADLSIQSDEPRELRLVLCGGDSCQKHNFQVSSTGAGFDIAFAQDEQNPPQGSIAPQSELDPPPGARRNWLDSVLQQHSFTLLLFYRGFW